MKHRLANTKIPIHNRRLAIHRLLPLITGRIKIPARETCAPGEAGAALMRTAVREVIKGGHKRPDGGFAFSLQSTCEQHRPLRDLIALALRVQLREEP
jgi:hypothetical protein